MQNLVAEATRQQAAPLGLGRICVGVAFQIASKAVRLEKTLSVHTSESRQPASPAPRRSRHLPVLAEGICRPSRLVRLTSCRA